MTSAADLVIVGGGPAGAAAAITAATLGLHVVVLERAPFPRDAVGEVLPPGAESVFAQLGVAAAVDRCAFLRHEGQWADWGGREDFQRFGGTRAAPWRGYHIWRSTLDTLLLDAARTRGAEVHHGLGADVTITTRSERVTSLRWGDHCWRPRFVFDATGRRRVIARQLGVREYALSPSIVVTYGYVAGVLRPLADGPSLAATPEGWTWMAQVKPDTIQWMRAHLGHRGAPHRAPPAALADFASLSQPRGADMTWRLATRIAGPNWMLVGDAAASLDPSSGQGVLRAMLSGIGAAQAAARALAGSPSKRETDHQYAAWLSNLVRRSASDLSVQYATRRRLPARTVSRGPRTVSPPA